MGSDIHAAIQIEAVGGEALHARIQGEVLAALLFGVFDQPIEKRGAESARAVGIVRDQIVDIEGAAGKKEIEDAKAGDRSDNPIQFEEDKLVSLFLLGENPGGEIDRLDVGTQLTHDGTTAADLFGRMGEADFPGGWFRIGHGISSPAPRRDQGSIATKSWSASPICPNVVSL